MILASVDASQVKAGFWNQ